MQVTPNPRTDTFLKIFRAFHSFVYFEDGELSYIIKEMADELSDVGLAMLIDDLKELHDVRKESAKSLAKAAKKIQDSIKASSKVRSRKITTSDLVNLLKELSEPPRLTRFNAINVATELAEKEGKPVVAVSNTEDLRKAVEVLPPGSIILFDERPRNPTPPPKGATPADGGATGGKGEKEEKEVIGDGCP